jgi:reverse gyrase
MPSYCPECGGEMQYISISKRYVCKSCGLSLTHQELIELRQQLRETPKLNEKEEKAQQRKEYLKWWLSKKK